VVFRRLRYMLSLRDLAEMFLPRGFMFTYEAAGEWEAKLTPALAENLRRKRKGRVSRSWYIDETYISVRGQRDRDGDQSRWLACPRKLRYRRHSRSCAFHAMSRIGLVRTGCQMRRYA
jgi:hypothetical protein